MIRREVQGYNEGLWMSPARDVDGRQLAAADGCRAANMPEPLTVSRKPMALPDALVYEPYVLTEEEIAVVEGEGT